MKTNTRSVPLDMLSVEHRGQHIQISTHRQSITVVLFEDRGYINSASLTFDQFHEALRRICEEAATEASQ